MAARSNLDGALRLLSFVLFLYLFLVAIELFGAAVKSLGAGAAASLATGLENPFAGLAAGVLSTVLVQSSSVTTSLIVGMVGTGVLPLGIAVPMVMGANVGTSVTNTLVSLGHLTRSDEFRRAFAGATVHDFFNIMSVAALFPLELATGFLQHGAQLLVGVLPLGSGGAAFKSPIKTAVKWLAHQVSGACELLGMAGAVLSAALIGIALLLVFVSLTQITRNMKVLIADQIETWLNRVLGGNMLVGLFIGMITTVLVQSSSITTSLLIPMFGAGVLALESGFPITVGANIGTTVTAIIAATVTGPDGLTIALVHLLFNVSGCVIFLPFRPTRRLPLWGARRLASLAVENRLWVLGYLGSAFVALPALAILVWR